MKDIKTIKISWLEGLFYCPQCKQVYYQENLCKKCMAFDWVDNIERKKNGVKK